jgi:hypothetical protein
LDNGPSRSRSKAVNAGSNTPLTKELPLRDLARVSHDRSPRRASSGGRSVPSRSAINSRIRNPCLATAVAGTPCPARASRISSAFTQSSSPSRATASAIVQAYPKDSFCSRNNLAVVGNRPS